MTMLLNQPRLLMKAAGRFSRTFSRDLSQGFRPASLALRDTGDSTGIALSTTAKVTAGDLVLSSVVPAEEIGGLSKQGKRSMQIGRHMHWDIRGSKTIDTSRAPRIRGGIPTHIIKFAFHANDPNCRLDVCTRNTGSGDTWLVAAEEDFAELARQGLLFVNVYARRHINAGGLLTYNFNSFEENISNDFTCMFSNSTIKGFNYCDDVEKKFLVDSGLAFPHIAMSAPNAKKVGLQENGEFGKALATFEPLVTGDIALINCIQPHELVVEDGKDMHTIQIGKDTHWDNSAPQHLVKMGQHAYDPSCRLDIMTYEDSDTGTTKLVTAAEDQYKSCAERGQLFIVMRARRDLEAGDLLTYNYNSFEDNISCTFTDTETGKLVGGFPKCDGEERSFLLKSGLAFPHNRVMAQCGWLFEGSRAVHL